MKFEHCALHRGTDRDLPCLRIRHDDGRIATDAEVWAEMQSLEVRAFAGQTGQLHLGALVDELRAERDKLRSLLSEVVKRYSYDGVPGDSLPLWQRAYEASITLESGHGLEEQNRE